MITEREIEKIGLDKLYNNELRVKRIGPELFNIVGYYYGEEQGRFTGYAAEVAAYLNQHFEYREH